MRYKLFFIFSLFFLLNICVIQIFVLPLQYQIKNNGYSQCYELSHIQRPKVTHKQRQTVVKRWKIKSSLIDLQTSCKKVAKYLHNSKFIHTFATSNKKKENKKQKERKKHIATESESESRFYRLKK